MSDPFDDNVTGDALLSIVEAMARVTRPLRPVCEHLAGLAQAMTAMGPLVQEMQRLQSDLAPIVRMAEASGLPAEMRRHAELNRSIHRAAQALRMVS